MSEIVQWDVPGWRLCRLKDAFGWIAWCFQFPAKVGEQGRAILYKAKPGEPWESVKNKLRECAPSAN